MIEMISTYSHEKKHAIGYSMGGRILLCLLSKFIHLFNKVILESVSMGSKNKKEKKQRKKWERQIIKDIYHNDKIFFLKNWYQQPLFSTLQTKKNLLKKIIQTRQFYNVPIISSSFLHLSSNNHQYLGKVIQKKQSDILYIYGEKDQKYKNISKELKKAYPCINVQKDC